MTSPRAPGRPRSDAVDSALLTAAQDLLIEVGFDRLSIETVAARAGTSKSAIYRRWSGKAELVVASVAQLYQPPPVPDQGSLREELLACGQAYVYDDDRTQRLLVALMIEMSRNAELRTAARQALGDPYAGLFEAVLGRADRQQRIAPGLDLATIAEIFPALAFHRVAVQTQPIDGEFVLRVVDHCLMPLLHPQH